MTIQRHIILLSASISFLLLAGCATNSKPSAVIPQTGPTMQTIYDSQMTSATQELPQPFIPAVAQYNKAVKQGQLYSYTDVASRQINEQFKRIPNPNIIIYVYPHLAGTDQVPVPGYTTAIPLYNRVYYALPGEVG